MLSESVTFQIQSRGDSNTTALEKYLIQDSRRAKQIIPGDSANVDILNFRQSLENLSSRLSEFLHSDEYQRAALVLGKIQSGKTSHLLGTLAWAVDSKFGLATIFTGITGELNNQTVTRLGESLNDLASNLVSIHQVPTNAESDDYQDLVHRLRGEIADRTEGKANTPLPVLVTMKNKHRLGTLERLFNDLSMEFGSSLKVLIVDDEADQASQNSKASTAKSTITYEALSNLRSTGLSNYLLSYTATPQAVLLTEKFGKLRPDECVVVPPRYGYFGLEHVCESSYANNLVVVDDWPATKGRISDCPQSLKDALYEFFLTVFIRDKYPRLFFNESRLTNIDHLLANKSLQMMIHEAVEVAKHKDVFKLVSNERKDLLSELASFVSGDMPISIESSLGSYLDYLWKRLISRLDPEIAGRLEFARPEFGELRDIVSDSEIVVVNAAKNRPNSEVKFPDSAVAWNAHKSWIVIGGDILGRGLTIPQLVSTYFLRSSKVPNFDTVSQQMRFCGYRMPYKSFTSIWAPSSTFTTFDYMNKVEVIMWNRAKSWDIERRVISKEVPKVIYASPLGINMEPTRKSVRDPNLFDKKVKGETIFTARKVMDPNLVAENLNVIKRWAKEAGSPHALGADWLQYDQPENEVIQDLLRKWNVALSEVIDIQASAELFEDDLEELGLAFMPKSLFVSRSVIGADMGNFSEIDRTLQNTKQYRTLTARNRDMSLDEWKRSFIEDAPKVNVFSDVAITHIGDTQRKLRRHLSYDAAILIVEFVRGTTKDHSLDGTISLGLCFSVLAPSGFEIRTLGHR